MTESDSSLSDAVPGRAQVQLPVALACRCARNMAQVPRYAMAHATSPVGYWAHCLRERGVEVEAVDMFPPKTSSGQTCAAFTRVTTAGPEVLDREDHQGKCDLASSARESVTVALRAGHPADC